MLTNEQKAVMAQFAGYTESPTGNWAHPDYIDYEPTKYGEPPVAAIWYKLEEMPYDTDWNWVMPIYRKCIELPIDPEVKWQYTCKMQERNIYGDNSLFRKETPEPLAIALYNFITFYNEHNEDK